MVRMADFFYESSPKMLDMYCPGGSVIKVNYVNIDLLENKLTMGYAY